MPERETELTDAINRRDLLKGVAAASLLGTVPSSATAAERPTNHESAEPVAQQRLRFQYAAKFVCGDGEGEAAFPGRYFTTVNVHNPVEERVSIRWKATQSFRQPGGTVSQFRSSSLDGDGSFAITCEQLREMLDAGGGFFEGFVVIRSPVPLDVVTVYSAGRETVQTLDVERVSPRRLRGDEDGRPDLVPVPDPRQAFPFCRRNQADDLVVVVANRGTAAAGSSTTRVEFGNDEVVERDTPALDVGESTRLTFPIPETFPSCFAPNCPFTITVDAGDDVTESNERNNVEAGVCIG